MYWVRTPPLAPSVWGAATLAQQGAREGPPPPPDPPRGPSTPQDDPSPPVAQGKVLFPDFNVDAVVPDKVALAPLQYAVDKIKAAEYVELWYFTAEGCREASAATLTTVDNTIGLLRTDTGLALQQVKASKPSRNVLPDESLSWDQITTARHNIIDTMVANEWPEKLTMALTTMYIKLEALKATGTNPRGLIRYHAVVRRLWHKFLKKQADPFNVGVINENLLTRLEGEM
jgi:hypothetical protein